MAGVAMQMQDGFVGDAAGHVAKKPSSKGAISQLQEFIQGARSFPMPASCPVLHWSHDQRTKGTETEFRATVSFFLDGVPHHTIGAWKTSKRNAQRDVSERVLELFVGQWGCFLDVGFDDCDEDQDRFEVDGTRSTHATKPVHDLETFCTRVATKTTGSVPPRWSFVEDKGQYQAFVEILLFGIPHTFPGTHSDSQEDACNDAACRVLWYFGQPGYEDAFEPDIELAKKVAHDMPKPTSWWVNVA